MTSRGSGMPSGAAGVPGVRRAVPADVVSVVRTLVESHLDYTWERWLLPDAGTRRSRLETLFGLDVEVVGLPHGDVWLSDDAASVAVWLPAGLELTSDEQARLALGDVLLGDRHQAACDVDAAIRTVSSPADWTLATMGTLPSHRRRGLATAVLVAKLADLDRAHESARLETSELANVRFYERLGFVVTCFLDELPADAPATWVMERPAR